MLKIKLTNRRFGCEFEFSTEWRKMLKIVEPIIVDIYGEKHLLAKHDFFDSNNNYKQWHLKIDNSTESELCTQVSVLKDLKKICMVMEKLEEDEDVLVTENDGFHVHVDIRDVEKEKLLSLWLKYEEVIFSLFPKYRRDNFYCEKGIKRRTKKGTKNIANYFLDADSNSEDHHFALSFYFSKDTEKNLRRKTVEFRVANGTKDKAFVRNWVLFCLHFVEGAKKISAVKTVCASPNKHTLDELIQEIGIKDKELTLWLIDRAGKL